MTDSFFYKIVRRHFSGVDIVSADIDKIGKTLLEILRQGDNASVQKTFHFIAATELADNGVGLPAGGEIHHFLHTAAVPKEKGNFANCPGFVFMRKPHDTPQKFVGIRLREVCHHENSCHNFSVRVRFLQI